MRLFPIGINWSNGGCQLPQCLFCLNIEDLFLNSNENLLFTDNFHPNDKGYELIAERLNKTLEEQVLPDLDKNAIYGQ